MKKQQINCFEIGLKNKNCIESSEQAILKNRICQKQKCPEVFNIVKQKIMRTCISGNIAFAYCIKSNCIQHNVFTCNDQQCDCYLDHQLCSQANIRSTLRNIQQNIKDAIQFKLKLKQQISNIFQACIYQLSKSKQKIHYQIDQILRQSQLNTIQKAFLNLYEDKQTIYTKILTSQMLCQLWQSIKNRQNDKQTLNNLSNELINNFKVKIQQNSLKNLSQSLIDQSNNFLMNILFLKPKIIQQQQKKQKQQKKIVKIQQMNESQEIPNNQQVGQKQIKYKSINFKSSILKNDILKNRFKQMFPKTLKRINLLFKASENDFKIQQFFKKHGNETNTVIVCLTKTNQILGGYTPFVHHTQKQSNQWVGDEKGQSFVFFLSKNQTSKFKLINKLGALQRFKDQNQFNFGDCLTIVNDANIGQNSFFNLSKKSCYINKNYSHNKKSYHKLTGNADMCFSAKQWEALKLEF